jgi:purine nucleosidase
MAGGLPGFVLAQGLSGKRRKVILDCDVGIDDATALLFAHYSPEIDLIGIVTSFGNTSIDKATNNTLYIKEQFDIPAPAYKGAANPLDRVHVAGTVVHGVDGMGDSELINPTISAEPNPAASYIADTILKHPGEITVICVGPTTNLVTAKFLRPEIVGKVKEIILMGGAVGIKGERGNVTPVAEANIIADALAASIAFDTHWPLTMVGLDVTYNQDSAMTRTFFERLAGSGAHPDAGAFLKRINQHYMEFYGRAKGQGDVAYAHDSMAIAYAIQPMLFNVVKGKVQVLTTGVGRGQTIFCPQGHHSFDKPEWAGLPVYTVCADVDGPGFLNLYEEAILGIGSPRAEATSSPRS